MVKRLATIVCVMFLFRPVFAGAEPLPAADIAPEYPAVSFSVGEQLIHKIYWGFIPVGSSVTSSRWIEHGGAKKILLRVRTRTNKLFDRIRPVNDLVESVVDPATFLPVSFRRLMIRRSQTCDEHTVFDRNSFKATWQEQCSGKTSTFDIKPDTRDILTFMYYMRAVKLASDSEFNYRVMADEGMFDLNVHTGDNAKIKLPVFGKVDCTVINPKFDFDGLLIDKGRFRLWISDDQRRIMTRAEINGRLADINVVLQRVTGSGDDFWTDTMKQQGLSLDPIPDDVIESKLIQE